MYQCVGYEADTHHQGCGGPWVIKPYAALLGRGLTPRLPAARRTLTELTYDGGTALRVRRELDNPAVLAGDMRPFVWRSGVYLSHWVLRNNTPDVEGNALQACTQSRVSEHQHCRPTTKPGLTPPQLCQRTCKLAPRADFDKYQQHRLVVSQECHYVSLQHSHLGA